MAPADDLRDVARGVERQRDQERRVLGREPEASRSWTARPFPAWSSVHGRPADGEADRRGSEAGRRPTRSRGDEAARVASKRRVRQIQTTTAAANATARSGRRSRTPAPPPTLSNHGTTMPRFEIGAGRGARPLPDRRQADHHAQVPEEDDHEHGDVPEGLDVERRDLRTSQFDDRRATPTMTPDDRREHDAEERDLDRVLDADEERVEQALRRAEVRVRDCEPRRLPQVVEAVEPGRDAAALRGCRRCCRTGRADSRRRRRGRPPGTSRAARGRCARKRDVELSLASLPSSGDEKGAAAAATAPFRLRSSGTAARTAGRRRSRAR